MSYPLKISLIILAVVASLGLAWGVVWAAQEMEFFGSNQRVSFQGIQQTQPGTVSEPQQAAPLAGEAPDISFIQSNDAACTQPEVGSNTCFINWTYLYVQAAPSYIVTMTVEVDNKKRASFSGFFQQSMYVPTEMFSLQVSCGALGSGGNANLGMQHTYAIRARDSANLKSANYGSVTCPAYIPKHVYLPVLRR